MSNIVNPTTTTILNKLHSASNKALTDVLNTPQQQKTYFEILSNYFIISPKVN